MKYGINKALELSDNCSSLYMMFGSMGIMLGPLYGQYGVTLFGYRETSDILGVISIINVAMFFMVGGASDEVRNICRQISDKWKQGLDHISGGSSNKDER